MPIGFKQQVAAARVQSKMRGWLTRKRLSKLGFKFCPLCSYCYESVVMFRQHMERKHESQFKSLVKRITTKEALPSKALNMPLKVKSPAIDAPNKRAQELQRKRPDSATRQRTKSVTGMPLMPEQDMDAFSKSTPIKNLNQPHPDDEFG